MTAARFWILAAFAANVTSTAGIATAQDSSFAVTLEPAEHGSIPLDSPLPEDGRYRDGTVV
jgi:hypothetical protein